MPTDTILSISFIFDILILVSCLMLLGAIMFAEKKIREYITEVKYLRSVCEQAIKDFDRLEERVGELEKRSTLKTTKAYYQGIMSERMRKNDP